MSVGSVGSSPGLPGWVIAIFAVAGVVVVGMGIWHFWVLRSGGLHPLVAREQCEAKLDRSQLMPAPRTIEERLAELDDLHDRGVITDAERAEARAKVLAAG
jgi:hypothetical protein